MRSMIEMRFTAKLLLAGLSVIWNFSFHDDPTNCIHSYSQQEIDYHKVAKNLDMSIFIYNEYLEFLLLILLNPK